MSENLPRPIKGGYLLLEVIGKGGMGVVYKGVHTVLEREVAIKVLHPNLTSDPVVEKRFLREARSIGRIKNKHVVEVLNFGKTEEDALYIVMEYIDGDILSQILRENKFLKPQRAIHIIGQICEALSAAHEQGVVHRDLKPANVMLLQNREHPDFVKLLDFGVAKILDETENTLTRDGLIVGTYSTMAPEQLLGYDVDGRADLYSLGIVLYTLLTGKAPFKGRDLATLCYQHVHVHPLTPLAANPNSTISPALNMAVMRALCKSPENRFPNMQAFADALKQSLVSPEFIPDETRAALQKDATTSPPTAVSEEERIRLQTVQANLPNLNELTTTDGRHQLENIPKRTVSYRHAGPIAVLQNDDRKTLWLFIFVLIACIFAIGWGIHTSPKVKKISPQPQLASPVTTSPKLPTQKPAPLTNKIKTKAPATPKLVKEVLPEKTNIGFEKKQTKKIKRKRRKPRKSRKPDLIRVHTQPKIKSKRNALEIK